MNFSQAEVAFLLGLNSGTTVIRHEDNQRVPTLDAALGYAAVLRVDPRELFAGRYEAVAESARERARELLAMARGQLPTKDVEQRIAHLALLIQDPEPHTVPWPED